MKLVSNRSARQAIRATVDQTRNHHEVLQALINDERVNRRRLDGLEAFRDMTFTERVRWLVRGYRGGL